MQTLQHLSKHIAYLPPVQETDRPVLAAVTGNKKTLIIDAGNSVSHARLFKDELLRNDISGNFLVLTHSHWDHVFGLENIKIPVICQEKTYTNIKGMHQLSWEDQALDQRVEEGTEIPFCADAIKLEHGTNREITFPLPDIIFEKTMTIDLGNITCIIEHVGGDHAQDSCIIYVQEEKTLFLGDCLYANLYAEKWNYTAEQALLLLKKIEAYDAETYILSHHARPCTRQEMEAELKLMKECARAVVEHRGNRALMEQELAKELKRDLTEDELETIGFFVNGYVV
ncbi:glyoxylase-like metal-dependent hydrolase (beta-lactamase superfamily II) [Peribacillus frigoritolerans]|uniref:MBL fold metallo-hydrolase n=1 Tax=Peribacillus frigoritolerans TaxID=450367 RepID=UPI000BBA184E|nr:MBL fold metallo-hydrolase [Peribacillus frigoritolerans]MCP1493543.1 glyoxylase-like metal-dependent hydrolase (beta-lactamase superfamily II) [Peribacillus frigoritolerans]PCD09816.1 Zn-dependent hydrolase [Peribacillus simplex]